MTRLLFSLLLSLPAVASAAGVTFTDICPSTFRVERSKTEPQNVEIYCMGAAKPKMVIAPCPAPAQIVTKNDTKTITCNGGWMTITVARTT